MVGGMILQARGNIFDLLLWERFPAITNAAIVVACNVACLEVALTCTVVAGVLIRSELEGFPGQCTSPLDARFFSAVTMIFSSICHNPDAILHHEIKVRCYGARLETACVLICVVKPGSCP